MLKSTLSIALVMCLIGAALPATAQEQRPSARPLAEAVAREAARFTRTSGQLGDSGWSRVGELEPGTELAVTVKGSPPSQQHFLAADDSSLTVLNAAAKDMSASVKQILIDTASDHPIYFVLAQQGKTFPLDGDVRLTREGVFNGDQKVTGLEQIVVQIARASVAEIIVRERHVGKAIGWGSVVGAGAGFVAGLLHGTRRCRTQNCENFPPAAFGMIYSMFGGGVGTGLGAVIGATKGKTLDVIYQAP
jgi:hypothetical protein